MSKFVKIAADPKFPSLGWFSKNAFKLFGKNSTVLKKMGAKKPFLNPAEFTEKFMQLIMDNDFQDVVFAALISLKAYLDTSSSTNIEVEKDN